MKCNKCGTENDEGTKFCANCGTSLSAIDIENNEAQIKKKGCLRLLVIILIVLALIFGITQIKKLINNDSENTPQSVQTAEPSDVELITYAETVLSDYLTEPTFKFADYYNVVETKGTLRAKVEGTVKDAYKTDHDFTIILEFDNYEYKTYSIVYLRIDDDVITTTTEPTSEATTKPTTTEPTTEPEPQATLGELNALRSAKDYLNYSGFSEEGLRKQLDYEGYSSSEIDYAIENCGADWNDECLETAKSYLDYSGFSEKGLRNQLDYEGYSSSEIDYAIKNCGADWNEECAECAKSYLEYSSFSRDSLKSQLEYEGFTSSQIEYGLSAVGY